MTPRHISRYTWIMLTTVFLLVGTLHAGTQPKFTIIPTTATTFSVPINSVRAIQYRVTNQTEITRTLTMATITGISQVTLGTGACQNPFTLASGQSCLLNLVARGGQLAEGVTSSPVKICKVNPSSNTPDPFLCSETNPTNSLNITRLAAQPRITVSPTNLSITINTSATMTVTNQSLTTTAKDIQAYFDNTALAGHVATTGNTCSSVPAGTSCTLTFTASTTPISTTRFRIQGSNTTPATATMTITEAGVTTLSVTPSTLTLTTTGGPGSLFVTNTGTTAATNITALLPLNLSLAITQTQGANCATLNPDGSVCELIFTPNGSGAEINPPQEVAIVGTGAAATSAYIAVNGPTLNALAIIDPPNGDPLVLQADGVTTGTMSIQNQSTNTVSFSAHFNESTLSGAVTATSCDNIAAGDTCIMTFTPGTTVTSGTVPIYGDGTTTVNGNIKLDSYYAYITNLQQNKPPLTRCYLSTSDGTLNNCSDDIGFSPATLRAPTGVTINGSGTHIYVVSNYPATVSQCAVDPSTGDLSNCVSKTIETSLGNNSEAYAIAYNTRLNLIYVIVNNPTTSTPYAHYQVDQCPINADGSVGTCVNTGALLVESLPQTITINSSGTYVFMTNYLPQSTGDDVTSCQVSANTLINCIYSNLPFALTGSNLYTYGISVNTNGSIAYVTDKTSGTAAQCTIDRTTGGFFDPCTPVTSVGTNALGIDINSASDFAYVALQENSIVQCPIDTSTGNLEICVDSGADSTTLHIPYALALYPKPSG